MRAPLLFVGRRTTEGSRGCYRVRSRQFGRTSAPMVPHFVHTMRGSNDCAVMTATKSFQPIG
jgi:hypothetical protein